MLVRYVIADLVRNPRRTLSTIAGVILGVGLFCGVLFFIDGLSASMTQRAVAPLAIDMQRIVTEKVGADVTLTQSSDPAQLNGGEQAEIVLTVVNEGSFAANEVTVRSTPTRGLTFVPRSMTLDDIPLTDGDGNPLSSGPARTGYNFGTLPSGVSHRIAYQVTAAQPMSIDGRSVESSVSTREAVSPTPANQPASVALADLASQIRRVPGVQYAQPLSIADLGPDTLTAGAATASGATKIFGFDARYAAHDRSVVLVRGAFRSNGTVVSVEASGTLGVGVGDEVVATLPDGSSLRTTVTGVADLSQARSLFSSRRGGDLETFVYSRNALVVSPAVFADTVVPAYERAAATDADRLKNPPIREVDVRLDRELLDADPATARRETERIATDINAVAAHQDYLLDNISNTLTVAADDADAAKRLFIFLGVPGALVAAILAAYAGNVLAEAQRREQAILRVRGAGRGHLRRMLALRVLFITATGATLGLTVGYIAAGAVLGRASLSRASTGSLVTSAVLGSLGGLLATGTALYVTGRRSIDREIDEDRARLAVRAPLWRRYWFDVLGLLVVVAATIAAIATDAFAGTAGSVYFGRAVELDLWLLVLPVAAWIAGSLLTARVLGELLGRARPRPRTELGPPVPALLRRSLSRRAWAVGNAAIVVTLIVGLAVSLAAFTAAYDDAKLADARFANGSDIRITPTPRAGSSYSSTATSTFTTDGISKVSPVVFGVSNVILRSRRTSDPANLAAVDPVTFGAVAPLRDQNFVDGSTAATLDRLQRDPSTLFMSADMADFLQVQVGDEVKVLLARATDDQVEIPMQVVGLFDRLPAFPDGADALMSLPEFERRVPAKEPDFFLARTSDSSDATLARAGDSLRTGPGTAGDFHVATRASVLQTDQSSLAALNIAGLVDLDSIFALAMVTVAISIFVFGLLLARRREYVTLRAQGMDAGEVRRLIVAEAGTAAATGAIGGLLVGTAMGYYFVRVLRPLFVLPPRPALPLQNLALPVVIVVVATIVASIVAAAMVQRLQPTELLRDE